MLITNARALVISATSSEDDILSYLTAICGSTSPQEAMRMVAALPKDKNTRKLGSFCAGAAMNIKEVIKDLRSKAAVTLTDEWMVNNDINFSILAMIGHILFMVPEDCMKPKLKEARAIYIRSIGGAQNISLFTQANAMEGKDKRTEILLKWASTFRNWNSSHYHELLAAAFPNLVTSRRNFIFRFFMGIFSKFSRPFKAVYNAIAWILSTIWSIFKWSLLLVIPALLLAIFAEALFPNSAVVVGTLGASPSTGLAINSAAIKVSKVVPATVSLASAGFSSMRAATPITIAAGRDAVASSLGALVSAPAFVSNAYASRGTSVSTAIAGVKVGEVMGTAKRAAMTSVDAVVSAGASSLLGYEITSLASESDPHFLTNLKAAMASDFSNIASIVSAKLTSASAAIRPEKDGIEDGEPEGADSPEDIPGDAADPGGIQQAGSAEDVNAMPVMDPEPAAVADPVEPTASEAVSSAEAPDSTGPGEGLVQAASEGIDASPAPEGSEAHETSSDAYVAADGSTFTSTTTTHEEMTGTGATMTSEAVSQEYRGAEGDEAVSAGVAFTYEADKEEEQHGGQIPAFAEEGEHERGRDDTQGFLGGTD